MNRHHTDITSRRRFIKASGIGLALPMLESVGQVAPPVTAKAKRLVCIGVYLGFHTPSWLPQNAGSDYAMPKVLAPLSKLRREFSLFSGLDHRAPNGHKHWHNYLTGTGANSVSIDQIVAQKIGFQSRFSSLQVTCGTSAGSRMSFTDGGVALPMIGRPSVLFGKLFSSDSDRERMAYLLDSNRSVLDFVMDDGKAYRKSVSRADGQKLDEYLTAVRSVEKEVQKQRKWLEKPAAKVVYPLPKFDPVAADLSLECETLMYDIMALALETDSTRVLTFLAPGSGQVFTIDGERLTTGYHGLSHHGNSPDKIEEYNRIGREHVKRFGNFLNRLKGKTDGAGRPLLDTTAGLFGSGMGNANTHNNSNLPVLLAGGGFRHGKHHIVARHGAGERLLGDLFLSLLESFDIEQDRFKNATRNMNEFLV